MSVTRTQAPEWTGRLDPEDGSDAIRLHQLVKPDARRAVIGFACDAGVKRNKGRVGAKDGPAAFDGLLKLCDELRDSTMVELGVRVEDRAEGSLWKLDDPATLRAELVAFGRLHVRGVTDGMPADEVLQSVRVFVRDEKHSCFFVIDDATDANAVRKYLPEGACRVLMTAHTDLGLPAERAHRIRAFTTDESIELLRCMLGLSPSLAPGPPPPGLGPLKAMLPPSYRWSRAVNHLLLGHCWVKWRLLPADWAMGTPRHAQHIGWSRSGRGRARLGCVGDGACTSDPGTVEELGRAA